eukprot:2465692-Alexandrium_andersonii.AAC.1
MSQSARTRAAAARKVHGEALTAYKDALPEDLRETVVVSDDGGKDATEVASKAITDAICALGE